MLSENYFLPVCASFIFFVTLGAAFIGMQSRLKFAKRLFELYKDKRGIEDPQIPSSKNNLKVPLSVALFSILSILILCIFTITNILPMSNISMIIFVVLILSCLISGIWILIEIESHVK